jgi:hypothetical protein
MATVPHRIGVYLGIAQFFFTLTWTVYVIFLPQLAAQVGIARELVIFILMAAAMMGKWFAVTLVTVSAFVLEGCSRTIERFAPRAAAPGDTLNLRKVASMSTTHR